MANEVYYVRPDEMWTYACSVSATVADDYLAAWLCDARAGRPIRATSGNFNATLTGSGQVGIVGLANHNLDAGETCAVGGDVTATLTANTPTPPDDIPLNPFQTVTPGAATSITLAIAGNSTDVIIGEFMAGVRRQMRALRIDAEFEHIDYARWRELDLASVPAYDPGLAARKWHGSLYVTGSQLDELIAWHQAQLAATKPSLLIPDPLVNDAWVVHLHALRYRAAAGHSAHASRCYDVQLSFAEYPRTRW